MDSKFVEGVVGGVLNRHKNRTLNKNKIAVLSVEIAAVLDDNMKVFSTGKSVNPPLNIEMWKGYNPTEESKYSKEYLEHWTCDICDENTHEVDYDYLGNGTNHLGCELKMEQSLSEEKQQLELEFPEEK